MPGYWSESTLIRFLVKFYEDDILPSFLRSFIFLAGTYLLHIFPNYQYSHLLNH
jgi:hypothetical protein